MSELPVVQLTVQQLEETFGVLFIGYVISMVGYGFTFFQTYVYYSRYAMDHWAIKVTVGSLCLLDTLNSGLISHALFTYLVTFFPLTTGLVDATSTYSAEIGLSMLAIFIVQIFYSHRLLRISRGSFLAGITLVLSAAAFALGLVITAGLVKNPAFDSLQKSRTKMIMASSQALIFLSGLVSTVSLFYYLSPARNPGVKISEGLYETLVTYVFSRGSLAALVQLGLFSAFISTERVIWMPFHLAVSKVFINSLLSMLNSRIVYKGQGISEEDASTRRTRSASFSATGPRATTDVRFNRMSTKLGVSIEISRSIQRDDIAESKAGHDDADNDSSIWFTERTKQ